MLFNLTSLVSINNSTDNPSRNHLINDHKSNRQVKDEIEHDTRYDRSVFPQHM